MKIAWTTQPLDRIRTDVVLVPTVEGERELGAAFRAIDRVTDGALARLAELERHQGKAQQVTAVAAPPPLRARRVVLVGLGKNDRGGPAAVRKSFAKAVRSLGPGAHPVATAMPPHGEPDASVRALVEGLVLGSYAFLRYRAVGDDAPARVDRLTLVHARRTSGLEQAAEEGRILGEATILARDLVNEPAGAMTPRALAREARRVARDHSLRVRIHGRRDLERRRMGGLLSVAHGSREEPQLIHLEYKPSGRAKRTVALVGKGITFDSGGLSLKPAAAMMTMKCDMAGGAAVLGAMEAIAQLRPRVHVHGIVPATENLPGPGATRPGDVIRISTGKTVEVLNTDAEGRLVLADALAYAESCGADDIVDLATLTGACVVALGSQLAAVYARDRELATELLAAAEAEGEPLWEMPLYEPYRRDLKSDVADLKNIGGSSAGSITAALFLGEFTSVRRWAHLDIAGPAFVEQLPDLGPKGATGYGVRTLVRWVLSL